MAMAVSPDIQQLRVQLQTSIQSHPLISSILLLFFILLCRRKFTTAAGNLRRLPPNPPKLPILGNILQLGSLPHRSLQALADKYGPLMIVYFGQAPTLVVSSAETAKEIMKTHDISFASRPKSTSADVLLYGATDVAFTPFGDYWRGVRKICVSELLSVKRVQSFQFVREEEVGVMVDKIRKNASSSINLSKMILSLSSNIIATCVLGERGEGGKEFGELARRVLKQLVGFSFRDTFPSLGWMDRITGILSRLNATKREVDIFLDHIIEEHRKSGGSSDDEAKTDFVHIILQLAKNHMIDLQLTQDNLKAILLDMFLGGTDTSSTTMEWAIAELVNHENIMRKAQEEVRRVVGNKTKVEAEDIEKMSYLKCIIKETLRLHPAVPLLVQRESMSSVKLGDYEIPPKIKVIVNAFAIQRDPKVWERAEEFIPERFENNQVDFKGQDFEFVPFGAGRRSCPGIGFGLSVVELALSNLLFWFDWKLPSSSGEKLDMTEVCSLNVSKKTPLCLVPQIYNP